MTGREHSDAGALRTRIDAFLAAHTTLSVATVGAGGTPAAAAVFYAHDADLNLYFLSEAGTQHGSNMTAGSGVACTIQADGQDWRQIRGLQISGWGMLVTPTGMPHATAVYSRKFAFVGALLAGLQAPGVLAGPLARARFWVLRPRWFRLIDNTRGFGFKDELVLPDEGPRWSPEK
jgi:hypothetical protein